MSENVMIHIRVHIISLEITPPTVILIIIKMFAMSHENIIMCARAYHLKYVRNFCMQWKFNKLPLPWAHHQFAICILTFAVMILICCERSFLEPTLSQVIKLLLQYKMNIIWDPNVIEEYDCEPFCWRFCNITCCPIRVFVYPMNNIFERC